MLDSWFTLPITIHKVSRNKYGDFISNSNSVVNGWLIQHEGVTLNEKAEAQDTDAIVWLPASAEINTNDVLVYDGVPYRALKIIKAKKGKSSTVQFLKGYLQISRNIDGVS